MLNPTINAVAIDTSDAAGFVAIAPAAFDAILATMTRALIKISQFFWRISVGK